MAQQIVLGAGGSVTVGTSGALTGNGTAGTPLNVAVDGVTVVVNGSNELEAPGGSSGTVTSVSVVSANGLAGTVATATTTPAITLSTSITGVLKGNGTAVSAATAGTDYVVPAGALGTPSSGTLTNCTGLPTAGLVAGAVTLAKIQNAGANSVWVGSGSSGTGAAYTENTFGAGLTVGASSVALSTAAKTRSITFNINGNGSAITTGTVVGSDTYVPYACTITAATLVADASGSIVIDVWAQAFGSGVPTVANTITASDLPTLSSAQSSTDTTLTGWTTTVAAATWFRLHVNSATTCKAAQLVLTVTVA
jgi:hypothetical protein